MKNKNQLNRIRESRILNKEFGIWNRSHSIFSILYSKFNSKHSIFSIPHSTQNIPYSKFFIPSKTFHLKGIASLPTVIVLGIVILAISVSIATVSFSESFISQGTAQSSKAIFYAEAGARDALVKIARNKNYVCSSADCYSIPFVTSGCGSTLEGCAKVSVSAGVGTVGDPKIIISKGQMSASTRTINVSVILDTTGYGSIATTTWSENTN